MNDWADEIPLLTLLIGLSSILCIISKWALGRIRIPASVGWLLIGILLRLTDSQWNWINNGNREVFAVLGTLGVACLLFHVGLQSRVGAMIGKLGQAVRIWGVDFTVSSLSGFVVAHWILGLSTPTSLIIATALTATSVGVSVIAWEQRQSLRSSNGQLMLDVAELDDVTGVVAMAILFTLLPVWHAGANGSLTTIFFETLGVFLIKMLAFSAVCLLFSKFIERRLTEAYRKIHPPAEPLVLILATSLLIASAAEFLGLSIAIGAFFAGVMFSRDAERENIRDAVAPIAAFITPFFFIGIGLEVDLSAAGSVLFAGLMLSIAAIFGKVAGKFVPGLQIPDSPTAWLLGFSMIPRAEIAMIIIQRGQQLGEWAVPKDIFGAMVIVTVMTCIVSPVVVYTMLGRWPQEEVT